MDEANTEKKSAILLDIENLVYGGTRDEHTKLNVKELTAVIAEYIEKIALSHHPIAYRYAAISLTPKDGSVRIRKSREGVWSIVKTLSDMGFTVAIIPQGKDAADQALYEWGIQLKSNPSVAAYVIGTGDGAGPLSRLVNQLKIAGKNVHVAAYDYIPVATKIVEEQSAYITTSVIAPQVHMSSEAAKETTTKKRAEPPKPSKEKLYRKAIESLAGTAKNNGASPEYQERILYAMRILNIEMQRSKQREFSSGFLMGVLMQDFCMLYRDADRKEIVVIVHAIIEFTDMFERTKTLRFNYKNGFIEKIKQVPIKVEALA